MRDHLRNSTQGERGQKLVGVRELKANAAHILREVRDSRSSYIVTNRGRAVGVIVPLDPIENHSPGADDFGATAAWDAFMRAGRRLEKRFRSGSSGVRLLSATRR
jgi:prevent-host-death family protein